MKPELINYTVTLLISLSNVVPLLGHQLGLDFTPPYLAPTTKGSVILKGVNYASGGGGILNKTGLIFVSSFISSSNNGGK